MARDPRRVYQTLPGGCQAEEGTVEPVCCHLTRSNYAAHTHTYPPPLPASASPGHGTEEEQMPSQGVWWDWGPRRAPELPACIFPSSAELSSRVAQSGCCGTSHHICIPATEGRSKEYNSVELCSKGSLWISVHPAHLARASACSSTTPQGPELETAEVFPLADLL